MIRQRHLIFGLAALLLLSIPFFRVLYFSDRVLLFRDLSRDFLVQKTLWADSLRNGEGLLLWNFYSYGGIPFFPVNVTSPLHPFNILFLLFPREEVARALSLFVWLHYPVIFLGAWFLLRRLKLSSFPAFFLAIGLSTSGYLMGSHSLPHILASAAAVPFWLYFLLTYFHNKRLLFLSAAGASLAWPIYGGDPQFTYLMALFSFVLVALRSEMRVSEKLKGYLLLGSFAVLFSAAQLLPTLELALQSGRFKMTSWELNLFSFHPLRLAESIFPLFFGNRFGEDPFWATELVNFPYKTPFVFSTYAGALTIFALLFLPAAWIHTKSRMPIAALIVATVIGLAVSFGSFFPLPLYQWAAELLPGFGLFRYPERFLFWPFFALWLLAALILREEPWRVRTGKPMLLPALALAITVVFVLLQAIGWVKLPSSALWASGITAILLSGLLALSVASRSLPWLLLPGVFLVQTAELWLVQSRLVWDQNIQVTDMRRYPLPRMILEDKARRKEEIQAGGAYRLSTLLLSPFEFHPGRMDHTASTTFSSFQNLLPNVPALYGIESILGYHSVLPSRIETFMAKQTRKSPFGPDFRFLHDLMGAYYVPERDPDQQTVLKINPTAQPYMFVPERTHFAETMEEVWQRMADPEFRPARDLVLIGKEERKDRIEERDVFRIVKRTGSSLRAEYRPLHEAKPRQLVWNEGYSKHWRAYFNNQELPVQLANGWSMAILLPATTAGQSFQLEFRYENPWIALGAVLTSLWALITLGLVLSTKFHKSLESLRFW